MSINSMKFELSVQSLETFFQKLQDPDETTVQLTKQIATLAKDALSQEKSGNSEGLLHFRIYQIQPDFILKIADQFKTKNHSYSSNLIQIAELYQALNQRQEI